jgi:hypothetical protein
MRGGSCIFVMLYLCLKKALYFGSNVLSELNFLFCQNKKADLSKFLDSGTAFLWRKISKFTHHSKFPFFSRSKIIKFWLRRYCL